MSCGYGMFKKPNELLACIAVLRQYEVNLRSKFTQMMNSGMDTRELEAMILAVAAETYVLETVVSKH
jgi:hypothetical protein